MIRISVSRADATVLETETLTAGRIGLVCEFVFSSDWDDLEKVAVFDGEVTREVMLDENNRAIVPAECMATAGYKLRCGVTGLNAEQVVVLPTVYVNAGKIRESAEIADSSIEEITPSLASQVISRANEALRVANELASDAESGRFDGAEGPQGPKGETGEDGFSPEVSLIPIKQMSSTSERDGVRITVTQKDGASVLAEVWDGQQGPTGPRGATGPAGSPGEVQYADIAPVFSTSSSYKAGDYVFYDGALYCFTADHAAGAWNASHATAVQLAEDVADLKSAFDSYLYGLDESFTVTANLTNRFTVPFIKGKTYTITNNTTAACNMNAVKKDGTSTNLSNNMLAGASLSFTPATDDYAAIKGWINGTGTIRVQCEYSNIDEPERVSDKIYNDLHTYMYGGTKVFSIPTASKTHRFEFMFVKGKRYAITNKTSAACTFVLVKADGTTVSLFDEVVVNRRIEFTIDADDYVACQGWFNGTGTLELAQLYSNANATDEMSLVKWNDGNVYVANDGVPQGNGMQIPNVTDAYIEGRTLLFEDDFDETELDEEVWTYEEGYRRNNEPQVYKKENVELKHSNLVITAKRESAQAMKDGVLTDFDWTSGSVVYGNANDYVKGRYEAKILLPYQLGAFPAFWGINKVASSSNYAEIDAMEYKPSSSAPWSLSYLDYITSGLFYSEDGDLVEVGRVYSNEYNLHAYHIYSAEVTDDLITVYVDGNELTKVSLTSAMSEFNQPMKWLLNLALSTTSGVIPSTTNEYKLYVDWFRIYAPVGS